MLVTIPAYTSEMGLVFSVLKVASVLKVLCSVLFLYDNKQRFFVEISIQTETKTIFTSFAASTAFTLCRANTKFREGVPYTRRDLFSARSNFLS